MPLIPFSSYTPIPSRSSYISVHSRSHSAPVSDANFRALLRVTSAKLIPGVMSEPPPGRMEKHRRSMVFLPSGTHGLWHASGWEIT